MYRAVLSDRLLRPYLLGAGASTFGDAAAMLGFLLVVYQSTGSAALVTGIALAEAVPYLIFGLIGGAITDRLPRLPLIVGIDTLRAAIQAGMFLLVVTGHAPYLLLVAAVATLQLGGCIVNPARRALLPDLTTEALLPTANAVLATAMTGAALVAPLSAAGIISVTGPAAFFAVDAVSYLVSAASAFVLSRRCRVQPEPAEAGPIDAPRVGVRTVLRRLAGDMREFWSMISGHRELRGLLIGTALVVLSTTWARQIGLLLLAAPVDSSGRLYTLLTGAVAAAGLVAGLALPPLVRRPDLCTYSFGALVWGVGVGVCVLPWGAPALFVGAAAQGVGFAITNAARSYVLQTQLASADRGQGFAAAATILYLADVASIALFGVLTLLAGTSTLMLVAAGATGAAAALSWLTGRRTSRGRVPSSAVPAGPGK